MNKQELIKQANEIQSKIDELQKEQNKLKELINKQNVRWRATPYAKYYTVAYNGMVTKREDDHGNPTNDYNYSVGNYFKTEQKAQDYKENLITKQKLKDLALRLNNEVEIDWSNTKQIKYIISWNNNDKKLTTDNWFNWQNLGQVYCLDENFLDIAKQEIGEEALIKLIKSGV